MPLSFPAEPTGTRAALAAGLSALAGPATPTAQAHATAAANAQAPPPLPVYPFGLTDLAGGKDPRGGSPVAWEYLLVAGTQAVRTAQVVSAAGGAFEFASVSGGQAAGLARAIE